MQGSVRETSDRRTRKRLATRQLISDAATRLFWERGFDRVTVDEIAEAADVGRMTVFNHFPRKEDMFFDREGEIQELAFAAMRERASGTSPLEALRMLAHRLVAERSPFLPLSAEGYRFVETVLASEALKARARQLRDEFAQALAAVLTETAGTDAGDADARLAAGLTVAAWSVAFAEGQSIFARDRDEAGAKQAFLALVDRGSVGVLAALADTPLK